MASINPRRSTRTAVTRSVKDVGNALSLNTTMTLRKSPTFHSPSSPSLSNSDDDDFVPPSIRRSQTNLDDVIDAHRRRVALIVDDINKSLSISDPASSSPKKFRDDSLPVPRSFLDLPPIVDPAMAKDAEPERRHLRPRNRRPSGRHASDSGLGTSVASSKEKHANVNTNKKASAITRSAATSSSTMAKVPGLSQRAINRITEHTLRPLLAKPSLKDFEPIVLDVPRRMRDKEIICLRDLEKTLIFMAPERTKTAALYLDFCLTSIQCIQSTVEYLSDREQTRPRDRPYTNLYFMDLEEQIRQYAYQLANAKDKANNGEDSDDMDVDPADEVRLHGGLSKNGRPAELVRVKKDGKAISMATGEPVKLDDEEDVKPRLKRSLSEQLEDTEEIMRSMARRKKNASPEELAPKKCREPGCNKEFKRPCDLTKHEKTHSRPWKCPVKSCKYHEYGWPTEKEMDRHHNDRHSDSPATYECYYKPCPYKSKRESNCKQHMEKAHGWTYVRTKTNGKKGADSPSTAHVTPQLTNAPTPGSISHGMHTPPQEPMGPFVSLTRDNSLDFPTYLPHREFVDAIGQHPLHISELEEINLDLSPIVDTPSTGQFEPYSGFEDPTAGPAYTLQDDELYAAPAQLPTPDQSAFGKMLGHGPFQTYVSDNSCHAEPMSAPHISPTGQGNTMLFTPKSLGDVDEGFGEMDEHFDEFPSSGNLGNDFQLFPHVGKVTGSYEPLFGEVPSAGMGFSQSSQEMFPSPMEWTQGAEYNTYHGQH